MTTNPGHALWTGIADADRAHRYLDRLNEPALWTGWGLRTLADTMAAYDPLSYHNGSVWPHDTAICAAGAARYGRWDIVDQITNGAFDAAREIRRATTRTVRRYHPHGSPHARRVPGLLLTTSMVVSVDSPAPENHARSHPIT